MLDEKPHILVVDDDDRLRALLKKYLSEQGFMVSAGANAKEARHLMGLFTFDLIILDVMMPEETGIELLATLTEEQKQQVLMLSAMGEAGDRVRGLEEGAQDYLVKPFEPKELVLRIRAILRRGLRAPEAAAQIQFGAYAFDIARQHLTRDGAVVNLTSSEAALLVKLAQHAGTPVTREALAEAMPGNATERGVDVQVTRLRKKIEDSEGRPLHIQTIRGAGYVLYADRDASV